MKSSSSQQRRRRRSSFVFATTTAALLLTAAPNQAHARNLRRSSSSSNANLVVEDEGFEVTSSNEAGIEAVGNPFFHDVLVTSDGNRDDEYDRSRHDRQLEVNDPKPKEYINDETLEFVSFVFRHFDTCINNITSCVKFTFKPCLAYLYCTISHSLPVYKQHL